MKIALRNLIKETDDVDFFQNTVWEDVLCTVVDRFSMDGTHMGRSTIVLMPKVFCVCDEYMKNWQLPFYDADEARAERQKWSELKKYHQTLSESKSKKSDRARKQREKETDWNNKHKDKVDAYQKKTAGMVQAVTKQGDTAKAIHQRSTLHVLCFGVSEIPALTLGFDKGADPQALANGKVMSKARFHYFFVFPCDASRELWYRALAPGKLSIIAICVASVHAYLSPYSHFSSRGGQIPGAAPDMPPSPVWCICLSNGKKSRCLSETRTRRPESKTRTLFISICTGHESSSASSSSVAVDWSTTWSTNDLPIASARCINPTGEGSASWMRPNAGEAGDMIACWCCTRDRTRTRSISSAILAASSSAFFRATCSSSRLLLTALICSRRLRCRIRFDSSKSSTLRARSPCPFWSCRCTWVASSLSRMATFLSCTTCCNSDNVASSSDRSAASLCSRSTLRSSILLSKMEFCSAASPEEALAARRPCSAWTTRSRSEAHSFLSAWFMPWRLESSLEKIGKMRRHEGNKGQQRATMERGEIDRTGQREVQ